MDGSMVRLTPNGRSVSSRQRLISAPRFSGEPVVSALIMPSAPALETAAASSAVAIHCIPPRTTGCSMPRICVARVFTTSCLPLE